MKRKHKNFWKFTARFAAVGCLLLGSVTVDADDGLDRLLNRATMNKKSTKSGTKAKDANAKPKADSKTAVPECSNVACLIPYSIEAAELTRKASHNSQDQINFSDPTGFDSRDQFGLMCNPTPLGCGDIVYGVEKPKTKPRLDEYVFDGNDRGKKVYVDQSWKVHGLDTEDTIGHFDTLDGRRIVTPSNRVAVYAPRFGAVRKLDGVFNARLNSPVVALEEKTPIAHAAGNDFSSTTKQNVAVDRFEVANRASGFVDRTRGVLTDNVVTLFGSRNNFRPYENLTLIRMGKFSNAESARLNLGMQSALVWQDNLGLQVTAKNVAPIVVEDVKMAQELVRVKSEDGTAILRVTKIASKIAARTGEIVDFTIRFDNLSGKKIGNVTIIDNLTRRLEYVDKSAESTLRANFINEQNDGGSLMLRWEITDPVEPHTGGIIRFSCRVR